MGCLAGLSVYQWVGAWAGCVGQCVGCLECYRCKFPTLTLLVGLGHLGQGCPVDRGVDVTQTARRHRCTQGNTATPLLLLIVQRHRETQPHHSHCLLYRHTGKHSRTTLIAYCTGTQGNTAAPLLLLIVQAHRETQPRHSYCLLYRHTGKHSHTTLIAYCTGTQGNTATPLRYQVQLQMVRTITDRTGL